MEQNIITYRSLKEINIITFWEVPQSDGFALMDKDYDSDKEYTEKDKERFKTDYFKLYDEYFLIKNNAKQKNTLSENNKQHLLTFKIIVLSKCYNALLDLGRFTDELAFDVIKKTFEDKVLKIYDIVKKTENRIRLSRNDTVGVALRRLQKVITSLQNQLQLSKTRERQDIKKEKVNFYDNIANVEKVLNRSIGDISKVNALQYLSYEKQAEEINKINSRNGR